MNKWKVQWIYFACFCVILTIMVATNWKNKQPELQMIGSQINKTIHSTKMQICKFNRICFLNNVLFKKCLHETKHFDYFFCLIRTRLLNKTFAHLQYRNSRQKVLCKKAVLSNFANFTGKHPWSSWSPERLQVYQKVTLARIFQWSLQNI